MNNEPQIIRAAPIILYNIPVSSLKNIRPVISDNTMHVPTNIGYIFEYSYLLSKYIHKNVASR